MPILLVLNLKGGVAKTTNAVAIAECLASEGHRTLLIDADHQCMAGELLLGENRMLKCDRSNSTLHDLLAAMLKDEFAPDQFAHFVSERVSNIAGGLPTLATIPCSVRIDEFATNMAKARKGYLSTDEFLAVFARRKDMMRKWLTNNYDFTLVDCPPSLSMQVRVFLGVADGYIVPCVPDRLSVRGSLYLLDRIGKMGFSKIKPIGTLWSLYREQNHVHRGVVERAARRAEPYGRLPTPFKTIIPNATAIAESAEPGKTPASFGAKYTSKFSHLFEDLCQEIIYQTEWRPGEREKRPAGSRNGSPSRQPVPAR